MFFHQHNIPAIEQLNLPTGRLYQTPEGKRYPSVTTVLSVEGNEALEEWRDKVGHEEADKIALRAARKGTKVHEACENTLLGKPIEWGWLDADAKEDFKHFAPVFPLITEIHGIEQRMWSDKIQVAGTADLIMVYKGKLCIADWKTSRRFKSAEDIPGYFMQMSSYALMFYERTGILVEDLCVLMTIDGYGLAEYWEKTSKWVPKFVALRQKFREERGF